MKRFVLLAMIAAPVFAIAADKAMTTKKSTTAPATAAKPSGAKYELAVEGMHCESCIDNLTKQLEAMSEIEKGSVKVDLKGNKATVTLKKGNMDVSALETLKKSMTEKLSSAGLTLKDMKVVN